MGKGKRPTFKSETRLAEWLFSGLYGENSEMTQPDLYHKSGVSQSYIWGVMNIGRIPDDEIMVRLARALNDDPTDALVLRYLDVVQREISRAPAAVQRRLKPIYDAIRTIDDQTK